MVIVVDLNLKLCALLEEGIIWGVPLSLSGYLFISSTFSLIFLFFHLLLLYLENSFNDKTYSASKSQPVALFFFLKVFLA